MANWIKIRNEYINGNISYRKLAEKHGIVFQTLRDRAIKEKWFEKRKEQRNRISAKTEQKSAEKIAEQNADFVANLNKAANELLEKIQIAIQQTDLYIERTKMRVPQKVRDKKTGEEYTAWKEEENIRLSQKDSVNIDSVLKLTNAIKTMQSFQMGMQGEREQEAPIINITVSAATPDDMESDDE